MCLKPVNWINTEVVRVSVSLSLSISLSVTLSDCLSVCVGEVKFDL